MNCYITADEIAVPTGGGTVTKYEHEALCSLGDCLKISRTELGQQQDPWGWDDRACCYRDWFHVKPKISHFYSGSFSKTVDRLKWYGSKIVYTIAAHDREVSKREHEKLGMGFPYTHLTNNALWQKYISGYKDADIIITPSTVSEKTIRAYGKDFETKDIRVIPHGCHIPEKIYPMPKDLVFGNMGSWGMDKGIKYLLSAWKLCNIKNAILLLAGKDSGTPFAKQMVNQFGGGNIQLMGWVKNPSDFYNSISCYVQSSATEGWGLEVTESLAHGRPVICSAGAGACDAITSDCGFVVPACAIDALADRILWYRANQDILQRHGVNARKESNKYEWSRIKQKYIHLWKAL